MKRRLLFICTASLDRSPAAESLFQESEKYEAKSCGISPFAEKTITKEALELADQIIVMEPLHKRFILENFKKQVQDKPEIIVLDIPNEYARNDPELKKLLRERLVNWLE